MRFDGRVRIIKNLRLSKFAPGLVGFDHIASLMLDANHGTGDHWL